jgi:hypothetical protein
MLRIALDDPHEKTAALEILRGLIDRVSVTPTDDGFEIELVGEIAKMVSLGTNDKAAPNGTALSGYAGSIKVVAGTRNHRQFEIEVRV